MTRREAAAPFILSERPGTAASNGSSDWANDLFISDGYINSRVAKYDKGGHWVKQWDDRDTADGQFKHAAHPCERCRRQHFR